jgi:hypothetical protein
MFEIQSDSIKRPNAQSWTRARGSLRPGLLSIGDLVKVSSIDIPTLLSKIRLATNDL